VVHDLPGIVTLARSTRYWRLAGSLVTGFVLLTAVTWGVLSLMWPDAPVHIHVRWKPEVMDAERIELERRFQLTSSVQTEGTSWEYQLTDSSTANIRNIVESERVDDTSHLNRVRYRPEFAQDRLRQIWMYAVAVGGTSSVLLFVLAIVFPSASSFRLPPLAEFTAALSPSTPPSVAVVSGPAIATAIGIGALTTVAITSFAGAPPVSVAGALIVLYVGGHVVGSLLVPCAYSVSLAVIRTVAGLLLAATGFLFSLVLLIPWWVGPVALVTGAIFVRRGTAFSWTPGTVRVGWDGAAGGIVVAILIAPIAVSFLYMAPGDFPPVFYNVDTPAVLEKVHGLVNANSFPPESLSNLGARRTYHYGTQAMAALISRTTGLLPHHSLFLIVLPLLTAGVLAAAVAAARYVSPALPRSIAVPLLLISIPALSSSFSDKFGGQLWSAATTSGFSIDAIVGDYRLWGILSNEAKSVGRDFVTLASIAGIAAAPTLGWALPVFLMGTAVVVKTPIGIALVAGFLLAEGWRALSARRLWPSPQALLVGVLFGATVVSFFLVSSEPNFRVELFPLYHLRGIALPALLFDVLWLFAPALVVFAARINDPERRSSPFLLMALAPVLVVNLTRLEHVAETGGGAGDDWLQILHAVPFLLHAFALSLASRRWARLGRGARAAILATMALAILPVATAALRYSVLLVSDPESGHEFVDNRPLAEALATVPTSGTVLVTNDLRYPAEGFGREERQMQIPALFGHQAFAVNYAYEVVPSAPERRELQKLLQQPQWSNRILEAASTHGWTHLLVRKDYVHPTAVPLERVFENDSYAVYRFP
jgi:hypothetical protein